MSKEKDIENKFRNVTLKIIREVYKSELKESYNQALKDAKKEVEFLIDSIHTKDGRLKIYDVMKNIEGLKK